MTIQDIQERLERITTPTEAEEWAAEVYTLDEDARYLWLRTMLDSEKAAMVASRTHTIQIARELTPRFKAEANR